MLMDPMGGVVMTNDGNAILREIQVQHPAAKSMIEISRTQDEEVGDGTTSVIVLGPSPEPRHALALLPAVHCLPAADAKRREQALVLAGEVLSAAEPLLEQKMHPTIIIQAFRMALEDIIAFCRDRFT